MATKQQYDYLLNFRNEKKSANEWIDFLSKNPVCAEICEELKKTSEPNLVGSLYLVFHSCVSTRHDLMRMLHSVERNVTYRDEYIN